MDLFCMYCNGTGSEVKTDHDGNSYKIPCQHCEPLDDILNSPGMSPEFKPYVEYCKRLDAINVYFKDVADASRRLTDQLTLFLSVDDDTDVVGCRIKGISSIIETADREDD